MKREPFEFVAISTEPGAVTALCRERKMFALNNFRKFPHDFVHILLANFNARTTCCILIVRQQTA